MTGAVERLRRGSIPLLVGALLGFICGYFAAGGGRPNAAATAAPADPNLLSDLAAAYRNRGEFKRAIGLFEKARAADPDHWQSLLNLVLINAFDTRDAGAARRHFAELKRRYPEVPNLDRIEKQIASLPGGAV